MALYNLQYHGEENEMSEIVGRSVMTVSVLGRSIFADGNLRCEMCKCIMEKDEQIYNTLFFDLDEEKNCLDHIRICFVCTACMVENECVVHETHLDEEESL